MRKLISALALAGALALPAIATADTTDAELALASGDYAQALKLYRAAGEEGDPSAQVVLGFMYWYGEEHYGQAVHADVNTAVDWFARAAEQGNMAAASMLTIMFQEPSHQQEDAEPALSSPMDSDWQCRC
jgi:TPR repeat protein